MARVFRETLSALAANEGRAVNWRASPRRYATYNDVDYSHASAAQAARLAAEDARAYEKFLIEFARRGGGPVFRTAFNAEALYSARQSLEAVKIEALPLAQGELLLLRDQAQGFYSGNNNAPGSSPDSISRSCRFRRSTTQRLLDFSLAAAANRWGGPADRIIAVYKFHLLDNRFARWIGEYGAARALRLELYQPDTMNRHLLRGDFRGKILVLGANEWLDVMHADLLARYGGFTQEERFSCNHYLDKRAKGIVEYQTVHGSADDIAGRGIVNPLATMRAAAAVLERHAGCAGLERRMETAIARAATSPAPTAAVVRRVLALCRPGRKTAATR